MKTGIYWQDPKYALKPGRDFTFDPSLVLYLPLYRLDGASFMSKDKYGHLCTVTGALWTPNGRYFDGDDDIAIGTALNLGTADFSIEFWIRTGTTGSIAISKYESLTDRWRIQVGLWAGIGMYAEAADVASVFSLDSKTAIDDDMWHHIVILGDRGNRGWIYLDGEDDSDTRTICLANDVDNTGTLYLGRKLAEYLTGYLGEVRIYNRVLTPLEVQHNYLATKWRYR